MQDKVDIRVPLSVRSQILGEKGNAQVKPMTTPKVAEPFFIRKQVATLDEKGKTIAQSSVFNVKGLSILHMNVQVKELWL